MILPALYGRSKNGKIKVWEIEAKSFSDLSACLEITHGYIDGQKQVSSREVEGKNIGKSNETSNYEQAISEAKSRWNAQKDVGYVEDKNNIPLASDLELFLPMLAHKYHERSHNISWPAYIQPKYNGFRCLAKRDGDEIILWSRRGKAFEAPTKIKEELLAYLSDGDCTDGELYHHGWKLQRISSAINKYNSDTDQLSYMIYDVPNKYLSFEQRFVQDLPEPKSEHLIKSKTYLVNSEEEALSLTDEFIKEGYEGGMARNKDSMYLYKNRSENLLKIKKFEDGEFLVIGVEEASGRDAGTAIFICQTEDGTPFKVRPMGTLKERAEYLENFNSKYYLKMLTVKYYDLTKDNIPFHATGICFRPEWDLSIKL